MAESDVYHDEPSYFLSHQYNSEQLPTTCLPRSINSSDKDFTSSQPSCLWTNFDTAEGIIGESATKTLDLNDSFEDDSVTKISPSAETSSDYEYLSNLNFAEREIIKFWSSRYVHQSKRQRKKHKIFPQKLLLRIPNIENSYASHALRTIFYVDNFQQGKLVFEKSAVNPNQFISRVRWDPEQDWFIGFGQTETEATNEACVAALKHILGEKEYNLIVTMNKWETQPGVNKFVIDAALSRKSGTLTSTSVTSLTGETVLENNFYSSQQLQPPIQQQSSNPPFSLPQNYPDTISQQQQQQQQFVKTSSAQNMMQHSQVSRMNPKENVMHRNSIIGSTGLSFIRTAQSQPSENSLVNLNNPSGQSGVSATQLHNNPNNDDSNNYSSDGSSIGGDSAPELTGESSDEDQNSVISQPKTKQEELRLKLLRRENEVIRFWLQRRKNYDGDKNTDKNSFTLDSFKLRLRKNLDQEAKAAFKYLFSGSLGHLKPVFTHSANKRPDLGLYYVRCTYGLSSTVHGYGKTIDLAENDAGIKALQQVFGEEEFYKINEMCKQNNCMELNMARINRHLTVKFSRKKKTYQGLPNIRYKHHIIAKERQLLQEQKVAHLNIDVLNAPDKLNLFPLPSSKNFTQTIKKSDCRLELDLTKKVGNWPTPVIKNSHSLPWFNFSTQIKNIQDSAVTALEDVLIKNSYPLPKYISVNIQYPVPVYKVECVLKDLHHFTCEAPTERVAKNEVAKKALKFLLGSKNFEQICEQQQRKQLHLQPQLQQTTTQPLEPGTTGTVEEV